MLVLQRMTHTDPPEYTPCSWADGTDAEIEDALTKHYQGKVNLHEYWGYGQERTIQLSAMPNTYVSESHVAQTVTFVILQAGGIQLADGTECAFVVGQKELLAGLQQTDELGGMYANAAWGTIYNWSTCDRRKWCNEIYKDALPPTFAKVFKKFKNYVSESGSAPSTAIYTEDYFSLLSEKEVLGNSALYEDSAVMSHLIQFDQFKASANRIKQCNNPDSTYSPRTWDWLLRTTHKTSSSGLVSISDTGNSSGGSNTMSINFGIAPFGVI